MVGDPTGSRLHASTVTSVSKRFEFKLSRTLNAELHTIITFKTIHANINPYSFEVLIAYLSFTEAVKLLLRAG